MEQHINIIITDGKAYIIGVKRNDGQQALPIYMELETEQIIQLIKDTEKSWADVSHPLDTKTQDSISPVVSVTSAKHDGYQDGVTD